MSGRVTFRQIRASQDNRGQRLPLLFNFVSIPMAWPITFLFCALGIGPNAATVVRAVVTVVAFALITQELPVLYHAGIVLYLLSIVLDNVDGQIARVRDDASFFGKYFDGVVDSFGEVGIGFFLGLHFTLVSGDPLPLILGSVASLSHAVTQLTMVRYGLTVQLYRRAGEPECRPHPRLKMFCSAAVYSGASLFFESKLPLLLWDIRIGGLLAAWLLGQELLFLLGLALAQAVLAVSLPILRLIRVYPELDAYRESASAANSNKSGNR